MAHPQPLHKANSGGDGHAQSPCSNAAGFMVARRRGKLTAASQACCPAKRLACVGAELRADRPALRVQRRRRGEGRCISAC